jgi:hypothetical protein
VVHPEPFQNVSAEGFRLGQKLFGLCARYHTGAAVVGEAPTRAAVVQVVGACLGLRPRDLRQRLNRRPMMADPVER